MNLEAVLLLLSALVTNGALTQNSWGIWGHWIIPLSVQPLANGLVASLTAFTAFLAYLALERWNRWWRPQLQFTTVAVLLGSIVLTVAGVQISDRHANSTSITRNDGVEQSVVAARMVIRGENPYDESFAGTEFQPRVTPGTAEHYAYPPLAALVFVPLILLQQFTGWAIDFQSLELALFAGCVGILIAATRSWVVRTRILILTVGNPFLYTFAVAGFNDFLLIVLLLGAVFAFDRGRWVWTGILFGAALAAKQLAWPLVPLWLVALLWTWRSDRTAARRVLVATVGTASVLFLPFMLHGSGPLFDDLIRYPSGSILGTVPLWGTTLAQPVGYLAGARDIFAPYSAWIFQGVVYLLLILYLGLRYLRRAFTVDRFLTAQAVLLLMVVLTNRYGAPNYFVPVVFLGLASYVFGIRTPRSGNPPRSPTEIDRDPVASHQIPA